MSALRKPQAGVTLIEMMIALALFALIGSAGFAMLDQVLRSQHGTEGRLERLSEQQRALHVVLADFAMTEPHSLLVTGQALSLDRSSSDGGLHLQYQLSDGILRRSLTGTDGQALADQAILSGVDAITWRFLTAEGTWSDIWPSDPVQTLTTPRNPKAVELEIGRAHV